MSIFIGFLLSIASVAVLGWVFAKLFEEVA